MSFLHDAVFILANSAAINVFNIKCRGKSNQQLAYSFLNFRSSTTTTQSTN